MIPFLIILIFISGTKSVVNLREAGQKVAEKKIIISVKTPPKSKVLKNDYFAAQTYNNCGPASLSMLLSYFNIKVSQEKLGEELRPYQNQNGDNDDKSVSLDELAGKAKDYDLLAYHRANGDIKILKQFIANNIPVMTLTWLGVDEDIGHYRVVKGYDDNQKTLVQDDSFEGPDVTFSYNDFDSIWGKFNYEYLVLVPKNKKGLAEAIMGKNIDERYAWNEALKRNEVSLKKDPDDIYSRFNIVVASYYLKNYRKSVSEFEKIQDQLPFRTLWYQIEPIEAYYKLNEDDKVLSLTDSILNNNNRAFSELYVLRGKIYKKQGDIQAARTEFENAVYYNSNFKEAQKLLKLTSSPGKYQNETNNG